MRSSTAGSIRSTHRSYAKLGPPLVCAPKLEMASSQIIGRLMKVIGDIKSALVPTHSGLSTFPISPMS